jgi:uncharacterized membrane protein YjgN (DUF898 family)
MRNRFELALTGRDWWKPFLGFWALFLALYVPMLLLQRWFPAQEKPLPYFLLTLVLLLGVTAISAVFTVVFLRIVMPRLSVGGRAFAFKGSIGKYLGMSLGRMALSIVTLMIYLPWYMRRVTAYLVSETSFDGTAPEFRGRGGRLFVIMLLSLWLPVIAVSVAVGVVAGLSIGATGVGAAAGVVPAVMAAVMLLCMIPFAYLTYKWYVNLAWKDVVMIWKTTFWRSCLFILGQVLLTLVTAGIYGPAAFLRLYRYFAGRTVIERDGRETGRLGFDGSIGKGFGLLWGQGLLCLVTVGVYLPWAYARVGRWLLAATYHEAVQAPA